MRPCALHGSVRLAALLPLALLLPLAGCQPMKSAAGGGILGRDSGRTYIEVRGYVLAPDQSVPVDAVGYAVPIFTSSEQASRFCPQFISRLSGGGVLDARTKMKVSAYGRAVQIAPFIWPVSSWTAGSVADCGTLVGRYNLSGAKTFYGIAADQIRAKGGTAPGRLGEGPYIMAVRRATGNVLLLDLSTVPLGDYQHWFDQAVGFLTDPRIGDDGYRSATLRDQVRFYVFGSIPDFMPVLTMLIPSFKAGNAKS